MTETEREMVLDVIENEGLDYTFVGYTHFDSGRYKVDDPEFHRLIQAYLAARIELAEYIGTEA